MRPIPQKLRTELEETHRMKRCELSKRQDLYGLCMGRKENPEWHHVWIYAGKQINEPWAILATCTRHHKMVTSDPSVKRAFEIRSLFIATDKELEKYPRKNWAQVKKLIIK